MADAPKENAKPADEAKPKADKVETPNPEADQPAKTAGVMDAPSPSAPAKDVDSVGLTPQQKAADTTPEQQGKHLDQTLAGALDLLADQVKDRPAVKGTTTVDFGDAGKLTGCLIPSNSTSHASGEQLVLVPYQGGYISLSGVPASAISQ